MGKLSGIGGASVRKGGIWFLPGNYIVDVNSVIMQASRKRIDMFIVETTVVESNVSARPEGSRPSWVVKMDQDAALGNIKGFIAACMGIDDPDDPSIDEDEWEESSEYAISKAQPLRGTRIHLECSITKTRSNKDFTLHRWGPRL